MPRSGHHLLHVTARVSFFSPLDCDVPVKVFAVCLRSFSCKNLVDFHQNIRSELEMVREDLSMTQKDKFMLQAKVSELKSSMKTLLQQNQQLKLDLRRGAARTVRGPRRRGLAGPQPCDPRHAAHV